jgi:hypothetical protein
MFPVFLQPLTANWPYTWTTNTSVHHLRMSIHNHLIELKGIYKENCVCLFNLEKSKII